MVHHQIQQIDMSAQGTSGNSPSPQMFVGEQLGRPMYQNKWMGQVHSSSLTMSTNKLFMRVTEDTKQFTLNVTWLAIMNYITMDFNISYLSNSIKSL